MHGGAHECTPRLRNYFAKCVSSVGHTKHRQSCECHEPAWQPACMHECHSYDLVSRLANCLAACMHAWMSSLKCGIRDMQTDQVVHSGRHLQRAQLVKQGWVWRAARLRPHDQVTACKQRQQQRIAGHLRAHPCTISGACSARLSGGACAAGASHSFGCVSTYVRGCVRHLGAAQPLLHSCGPGVPERHSPALSCLRCGAPAGLRTVLDTRCCRDLDVCDPVPGNQGAVSLCFCRALHTVYFVNDSRVTSVR